MDNQVEKEDASADWLWRMKDQEERLRNKMKGLNVDIPRDERHEHDENRRSWNVKTPGKGNTPLARKNLLEESAKVSPSLARSKLKKKFLKNQEEEFEEEKETATSVSEIPRTPHRTKLALETHRETVTDVKNFVCQPVPIALGPLECSLTKHVFNDSGIFGGEVEVWELRITDRRIKYDGLAKFTNVNDASSAGCSSSGPSTRDLISNRLVLIVEKKVRGFLKKTTSYTIAMADTSSFHQQIDMRKTTHLVGKLEGKNWWGTTFKGFDLHTKFKSSNKLVPIKRENLLVKYECSLGHPRQLLVAIPFVGPRDPNKAFNTSPDVPEVPDNENDEEDCDELASEEKLLWKNETAPEMDKDLEMQVIPETKKGPKLEENLASFDQQNCHCFHNRKPVFSEELQTHILDFAGRVTQASVKNFQLDHSTCSLQNEFIDYADDDSVLLHEQYISKDIHAQRPVVQFGKCSPETAPTEEYTLDVQYPFSVLQALQLALTSIENKIVYY